MTTIAILLALGLIFVGLYQTWKNRDRSEEGVPKQVTLSHRAATCFYCHREAVEYNGDYWVCERHMEEE